MAVALDRAYYQAFAIGETKNRWAIPTNGAESMVVSSEPHTSMGAAIITLYQSLDGVTAYPLATHQTISAADLSKPIDCSGVPFIVAEVSTKGTAGTFANLTASRSKSL